MITFGGLNFLGVHFLSEIDLKLSPECIVKRFKLLLGTPCIVI